ERAGTPGGDASSCAAHRPAGAFPGIALPPAPHAPTWNPPPTISVPRAELVIPAAPCRALGPWGCRIRVGMGGSGCISASQRGFTEMRAPRLPNIRPWHALPTPAASPPDSPAPGRGTYARVPAATLLLRSGKHPIRDALDCESPAGSVSSP